MATDYKTRLTADTSQHDKAINKSAQQIYKYKKQTDTAKTTLAGLAKKFGPLAAQIGIAGGALGALDKAFRGTEQGADSLDSAIYATKSSVNKFFQTLSNGSFDAFLGGLSDIVSTAKEAYNALDALGTASMWKNARISQLNAKIAEDRVIVNNSKSSAEDRAAAQQRINLNMDKIQALSGQLVEATMNAATAKLREIAGTSKVSNSQLQKYLEMWESGTLSQHYSEFMAKNSYQSAYTVTPTEGTPYTMYETKYYKETDRILANAMRSIMTTNESELKQYYDLLQQAANLQTTTANERMRADRAINKGNTTTGTTNKAPSYQQGSIADIEHQIEELQKRLKNEALQGNEVAVIQRQIEALKVKKSAIESLQEPLKKLESAIDELPTIDEKIIDSDAINAELQSVIDNIEEVGMTIDELKDLSSVGDSIGYIGDMFADLSSVMDEESGKIFAALGNSIGAIGTAIAKVSSLMMAEGAASVMDLPYPANLAALASVIAAVTAVIASIQSLATQSFADGGIVQGKTTIGDYNLARVNSGEMILNGREQARLFKMLSGGSVFNGFNADQSGNVTFTIHGSDLQGTLNNYSKKAGRVR